MFSYRNLVYKTQNNGELNKFHIQKEKFAKNVKKKKTACTHVLIEKR